MSLADTIIAAMTAEVTKKIMGKIFSLRFDRSRIAAVSKDIIDIALEVKQFAFDTWTDDDRSTALIALVEVTNRSAKKYMITEFQLQVGSHLFKNVYINEIKPLGVSGSNIEIWSGERLGTTCWLPVDFIKPLHRPFLETNESALGIIAFRLNDSEQISGDGIFIRAKIAGFDMVVSDVIL